MGNKKRKPFGWFSSDDEDWFKTLFSHLSGGIEKEQEELSKDEYRSGISFRISSDGKHPPKIEVSCLGPRGWEPARQKNFGIVPVEEIEKSVKTPTVSYPARAKPVTKTGPHITYEEAQYSYSIDINKVTIELKISGAEKEENVNLRFNPESLEIKAIVPQTKKGYFAVLKVPAQIDRENTKVKLEKDKVVIIIPRKHPIIRGVER